MTTSDASWSIKLRLVGDLERPDHHYLDDEDSCAYFGAYTARAGFAYSETNQIISNLKKSPSVRHTSQWQHKSKTIRRLGNTISNNIEAASWAKTVFVPVPPSKAIGSLEYDDRMLRVAQAMGAQADVREILFTAADRNAMHITNDRRDPDALRASIAVNNQLTSGNPEQVVLLDDVLTTGCSFRVCKGIIGQVWPLARVTGIFVARRVFPNPFENVGLEF